MGNKSGKPRHASEEAEPAAAVRDEDAPPPLCAADSAGLGDAAISLRRCGVACVRVDDAAAALHRACFEVAKDGMDSCEEMVRDGDPLVLADSADSGHATGVHAAGWGSSYNQTREGFVFSDGATFGVPRDDPYAAARFEAHCRAMHDSALALARGVLAALERHLDVPTGWFEVTFGPIANNSQWHVKRYRPERADVHARSIAGRTKASKSEQNDKTVLLPVHTDPSLVSIVLHDAPVSSHGAAGLEFLSQRGRGVWVEVPKHGHDVATVFVGSVLDRITRGAFPAARHRVAVRDPGSLGLLRVAATFFWRPAPNAMLKMPPSRSLLGALAIAALAVAPAVDARALRAAPFAGADARAAPGSKEALAAASARATREPISQDYAYDPAPEPPAASETDDRDDVPESVEEAERLAESLNNSRSVSDGATDTDAASAVAMRPASGGFLLHG